MHNTHKSTSNIQQKQLCKNISFYIYKTTVSTLFLSAWHMLMKQTFCYLQKLFLINIKFSPQFSAAVMLLTKNCHIVN